MAGLTLLAFALGFVFNGVRIAVIVMTTLRTDFDYGLIHEGLGTGVYILALTAVCGAIRWGAVRTRPV